MAAKDPRTELVETLAHFEHDSWSRWMDYLASRSVRNEDGSMTIPAECVARWDRQALTEYKDLTEKEKESDREEVRKILPVIDQYANRVGH